MKRNVIPYNEHLKTLAKKLREKMTFSEVKLWNEIKNKKLLGYDFDRQRPVGNYIVDFFCKDLQLAIEIDGITHEESEVAKRDITRIGSTWCFFHPFRCNVGDQYRRSSCKRNCELDRRV